MQTNRKSFGTFKNDRYVQVAVMDEWPLWQVLLYIYCSILGAIQVLHNAVGGRGCRLSRKKIIVKNK